MFSDPVDLLLRLLSYHTGSETEEPSTPAHTTSYNTTLLVPSVLPTARHKNSPAFHLHCVFSDLSNYHQDSQNSGPISRVVNGPAIDIATAIYTHCLELWNHPLRHKTNSTAR